MEKGRENAMIFLVGLWAGCAIGIVIMCLIQIHRDRQHMEKRGVREGDTPWGKYDKGLAQTQNCVVK